MSLGTILFFAFPLFLVILCYLAVPVVSLVLLVKLYRKLKKKFDL